MENMGCDMIDPDKLRVELTAEFRRLKPQVIRPAEGYLKFLCLIPGGFYNRCGTGTDSSWDVT
jgi:hypothetical protein